MNLLYEGGEIPAAVVAAHVGHLPAPTVVEHLAEVLKLLHASTKKKIRHGIFRRVEQLKGA
jgi:hypothetical protein